ncbi:MAG TPA: nuclear transport factor 2 family protein [Novosphingobium sp.]|nr:nuclear transport factor 2 family protein [Novosphingobium sp.]HZV09819.1 nuclear transport factor 2 family protein [Novosphingobium sp.]
MTSETIEQRLDAMTHEIDRLKAITAIQNTMSHYETVHCSGEIHRTTECFALWRPDCTAEVAGWGCFVGTDTVKEFWGRQNRMDPRGAIFFHTLASPAIEVAGDGKTAKATWASPGFEGARKDGDPLAFWCWGKYGADFIRNPATGEWKIWHLKWFRTIRNHFNTPWPEESHQVMVGTINLGDHFADLNRVPSAFHRPYQSEEVAHPFPVTPQPYADYDGNFHWMFGGAEMERQYGLDLPDYSRHYNAAFPDKI